MHSKSLDVKVTIDTDEIKQAIVEYIIRHGWQPCDGIDGVSLKYIEGEDRPLGRAPQFEAVVTIEGRAK